MASSRGFITLGIDNETDQVLYSYVLGLTIKKLDPSAEICLVVANRDSVVNDEYINFFDYIVELPFGNTASLDGMHASNFWQLIHCTPFDETIYIDADSIVNGIDLDILWDAFSGKSIAMPTSATTYRNTKFCKQDKFYIETHYGLPTNFGSLVYFNKTHPLAYDWFKMADVIFQNWKDVYPELFDEISPKWFEKNLLINIVTYMMDMDEDVRVNVPFFYDLAPSGQGFWGGTDSDIDMNTLNIWYTDERKLIVENSVVGDGVIHYRDRNFINRKILNVIECSD